MGKKLTSEEFVQRATKLHDGKFDYKNSNYVRGRAKIEILCKICDKVFFQRAENHLGGQGCPFCANNLPSTTEEFVRKALEVHGNKFKYNGVIYKNSNSKVRIFCNACEKIFEQTACNHINSGNGCPYCAYRFPLDKEEFVKRSIEAHGSKFNYNDTIFINTYSKTNIFCNTCETTIYVNAQSHMKGIGCGTCFGKKLMGREEFIRRSKEIHKEKFNYDKVEYINANVRVELLCNDCGEWFFQTPGMHLSGKSCGRCFGNRKISLKDFLRTAAEVHNNYYNYSKSNYTAMPDKITISCPEGHDFLQVARDHLQGYGCNICSGNVKKSKEQFIKDSIRIHFDRYDYDKILYVNFKTKVEILCNACGKYFWQRPNSHVTGKGCPACKFSKGEKKVAKILNDMEISFKPQATFIGLKFKNSLRVDFHLLDLGMVIEYDGEQHFADSTWYRNNNRNASDFEEVRNKDLIKNNYFRNNRIPLLRIPYWRSDTNEMNKMISQFINTRKTNIECFV